MGMCVLSHSSHVWLFETPRTVARQPPLSMEFSKQEYGSGLPCPSPGGLPDLGDQTCISCITGGFFTVWDTGRLHNGNSAFIIRDIRELPSSFSFSPPNEGTVRRWPSASQGEDPQQEVNLPALWSWNSQPPELGEISVCGLSISVYRILLGKPKLAKTVRFLGLGLEEMV